MSLKSLRKMLLITSCLLSVVLFSQKTLSDNPDLITKEEILQLAFKEGALKIAKKENFLNEVLGLKKIPIKDGSLDISKLDLKKVDFGQIIGLLKARGISDFSNFDLSETDLSGEFFRDHTDYVFDNVNFKGANLDRARFMSSMRNILTDENTTINMTDFSYTDVIGADFSKIKNLKSANWAGATYDNTTQFPRNFKPERHWMIKYIPRCRSLF